VIPVASEGHRIDEARREIELLRETVAALQWRIDKQAVLMRAFFALVSETHGIAEADLLTRFRIVDLEKSATPVKRCDKCGRTVSLRHKKCYYCGEPYRVKSAFELLDSGVWPDVAQGLPAQGPTQEHGFTSRPPRDSSVTILPGD
jgi:ribosomal protein S27AE